MSGLPKKTVQGVVIIYGPMASGKTSNAQAFMRHFGCTRLVDGWCGQRLQPGDLALSLNQPPFPILGATVLDIVTALRRLKAAAKKANSTTKGKGKK